MENQEPSQRYPNRWKRPVYPQKTDSYQKNGTSPARDSAPEPRGQNSAASNSGTPAPGSNPPEKISDFRDLHIWKLGKELVIDTYKTTKTLPPDELYGLTTQLRRAAISIPSNIAEGFNRRYTKDYQRFLSIALGSCAELETQVEVCKDLGYFSQNACDALLEKTDHETRMIRCLMNKL